MVALSCCQLDVCIHKKFSRVKLPEITEDNVKFWLLMQNPPGYKQPAKVGGGNVNKRSELHYHKVFTR